MKYNSSNKPLVCMQTHSDCYKETTTMAPVGVLWHSTGANNNTIKRYVQPYDSSNNKEHPENTYTNAELLKIIGKNSYNNDWNHKSVRAGLNCWIGKLADGTVATVQTMPWNYRPWGCGGGSKGSCNSGWMQFEICEDGLANKDYFNAVYQEACEITAYYCQMYNIDPKGTIKFNGVTVPTILDHKTSCKLGLGSNHGDVEHWFKKHGKTLDDVRNDVAALMGEEVPAQEFVYGTVKADGGLYVRSGAGTSYSIVGGLENGSRVKILAQTNSQGMTWGKISQGWISLDYVILDKASDNEVQKLFRVRKSWSAADSQKGAFATVQNAIDCCQAAGEGYKVFDWDGKEVYAYTAPEPSVEEIPTKAVYDLEYPQKHPIIEPTQGTAFDKEACTKVIIAIKKNNADFDVEIAKTFFTLAPKYGINPTRAIAQSILETGWFKFVGSSVKPEQHNYCGLGATGGGVSGASFDTIEDGVRAQLQHLYAYGCNADLPDGEVLIDPRFKYVTRGIAPHWEQLAGRWAIPGYDGDDAEVAVKNGATYGQKIDNIAQRLVTTAITDSDIELYFVDEDVHTEKVNTTTVNVILDLLKKILTVIIGFFSKK